MRKYGWLEIEFFHVFFLLLLNYLYKIILFHISRVGSELFTQ